MLYVRLSPRILHYESFYGEGPRFLVFKQVAGMQTLQFQAFCHTTGSMTKHHYQMIPCQNFSYQQLVARKQDEF